MSTGIPSSTFITISMIGYDVYLSTMSKTLVSLIYFRFKKKKRKTQFFLKISHCQNHHFYPQIRPNLTIFRFPMNSHESKNPLSLPISRQRSILRIQKKKKRNFKRPILSLFLVKSKEQSLRNRKKQKEIK